MAESVSSRKNHLHCTVDRIERTAEGSRLAVLVFDDGQQLVVEVAKLPEKAIKGKVLRVLFLVDDAETTARQQATKSLQDELFRD